MDERVDWSNQPDEQLLAALSEDPSALGPLYDRHSKLVYGLALAVLSSADEAADLTQEVFLSLCNENTYDASRGSVGAYLTTVVRTRAIDRLRRRTRRVRLLRDHHAAMPVPVAEPTPVERLSMGETSERVRAALATLPDNERRALEMAYFQGLTQAEIADDLNAPLGTVKSWCRRGLLTMKKQLGDLVQ
ncbi:MAG TPA: sigma-70 family RNA polymerase sigma factor [Candidatus Eisenbacteria bacterium]|nr:sigma-70 family RNA polymerase sigma factor [Candidatus Eisenbacteria bacterium]